MSHLRELHCPIYQRLSTRDPQVAQLLQRLRYHLPPRKMERCHLYLFIPHWGSSTAAQVCAGYFRKRFLPQLDLYLSMVSSIDQFHVCTVDSCAYLVYSCWAFFSIPVCCSRACLWKHDSNECPQRFSYSYSSCRNVWNDPMILERSPDLVLRLLCYLIVLDFFMNTDM